MQVEDDGDTGSQHGDAAGDRAGHQSIAREEYTQEDYDLALQHYTELAGRIDKREAAAAKKARPEKARSALQLHRDEMKAQGVKDQAQIKARYTPEQKARLQAASDEQQQRYKDAMEEWQRNHPDCARLEQLKQHKDESNNL